MNQKEQRNTPRTQGLNVIYDDEDDLTDEEYAKLHKYNVKYSRNKLAYWFLPPILVLLVIAIIVIWPKQSPAYLNAEHSIPKDVEDGLLEHLRGWEGVPDAKESAVIPKLGDHVLFVEKRSGMRLSLTAEDRENRTVTFELQGLAIQNYDSSSVKCVSEGEYYNGKNQIISAPNAMVTDIRVSMRQEENYSYTAVITLSEREAFSWELFEDEHYFFLNAK